MTHVLDLKVDDLESGRNRRRSSVLFPFEPNSERGAFIQFMEESGANSVLIKGLKALYDFPEKPDTPVDWLAKHFRQSAPKRDAYMKETKSSLRKELLDIESLILQMKEEESEKVGKLRNLCKIPDEDEVDELPDPKEFDENPQLRIDTRWRIAPDPFFKATCSKEQLAMLKQNDFMISGSEEEFLGEVDYYHDNLQSHLTSLRGEGEIEDGVNEGENEMEEQEDEEWINAYNIYKKTSKLPQVEEKLPSQIQSEVLGEFDYDPALNKPVEECHPHTLPKNFWVPGYTIDFETRYPDEIDSSDESQGEDGELKPTSSLVPDPQNYYRPSRGPYRFVKRPERPDIIYEHLWQLWQTDLPGRDDINYLDELNSRMSASAGKSLHGEDEDESTNVKATESHAQKDCIKLPATNSSLRAFPCNSYRNVFSDF